MICSRWTRARSKTKFSMVGGGFEGSLFGGDSVVGRTYSH